MYITVSFDRSHHNIHHRDISHSLILGYNLTHHDIIQSEFAGTAAHQPADRRAVQRPHLPAALQCPLSTTPARSHVLPACASRSSPNNAEDSQLIKNTVLLRANADRRVAQRPCFPAALPCPLSTVPLDNKCYPRVRHGPPSTTQRTHNNHATTHLMKITMLLQANDAAVAHTCDCISSDFFYHMNSSPIMVVSRFANNSKQLLYMVTTMSITTK